jgi:16S rRNA processing protein RimM
MEKKDFLPMGKIVGAHGVSGTLKVRSYAESFSVFKPEDTVFLTCPAQGMKPHTIQWARPHHRVLLLCVKGIFDRNMAEAMVGSEIFIKKSNLPELEAGSYYWADLIGLSVVSVQDEYLGQLTSIIATGSNDVYIVTKTVEGKNGEICIPALESVVLAVDLEKKSMRVDLPRGL